MLIGVNAVSQQSTVGAVCRYLEESYRFKCINVADYLSDSLSALDNDDERFWRSGPLGADGQHETAGEILSDLSRVADIVVQADTAELVAAVEGAGGLLLDVSGLSDRQAMELAIDALIEAA